jgi:hypothetical protein
MKLEMAGFGRERAFAKLLNKRLLHFAFQPVAQ